MENHSMINTTFPVDLPELAELTLTTKEFERYITALFPSTFDLPVHIKDVESTSTKPLQAENTAETSRFMDGLSSSAVPSLDKHDGKMPTENRDVAHADSGSALVDLFHELEDVVSGDRMKQLLDTAWKVDATATLKIIWNARSIHLGKSSRNTFYRAVGWLAENHPHTLLGSLPWLVRPLIQKKAPKPEKDAASKGEASELVPADDDADEFEMVEVELDGQPSTKKVKLDTPEAIAGLEEFDVKYGVAHGYWKDLLNILALAANDQLKVNGDPRSVFNVPKPTGKPHTRDWTKGKRKIQTAERHERVIEKLTNDLFYKALHLTIARLFANQLKADLARLESNNKSDRKLITLAGKWAPSNKGMHDQYTCIATSIAELLYPFDTLCSDLTVDPGDRTLYLKHARRAYQVKTLSVLRKHLDIVETKLTNKTYEAIKYDRIPSLAMKQYTPLFAEKDFDRFDKYLDSVAEGKSSISGATLLPSTLVSGVGKAALPTIQRGAGTNAKTMVEEKMRNIRMKSTNGQWKALVQRIKDNGTLESSIAVCDVSGSMTFPQFPDRTCPMDSAIGLSLLIAEVTAQPFGGHFITFSAAPQVLKVGGSTDNRTFEEKVQYIQSSDWGMNTDFVAVFERLILPMAIEKKLTQEEMVKQVFVFSDMQFDAADTTTSRWSTSYERIQKKYKEAGYEMPKLIFWNLAGGRAGYQNTGTSGSDSKDTAPKPVTAAEENTALVSGYSQGQLKMFLDNGQFKDAEDEEVIEDEEGEDGDEVVVGKTVKKARQDPLAMVRKAISHEAYRMLKVMD
ncbi:hypothetical protein LTR78_008733 [Recurvomyces mirabilis]|uniref:Uncharacterized protein n=1 Tax=Recurvomyces mirabilis TaxID=574656 RepID=A0AAE0TQX3_9PEZI|nr:hypothetical protein LTR78_008733 [Recurvomyces mirabilis]KAK5159182.1 hypothetical protein LTS14_002324 [Recurvomyces mirabilis]